MILTSAKKEWMKSLIKMQLCLVVHATFYVDKNISYDRLNSS
jgi:hypothetical protein